MKARDVVISQIQHCETPIVPYTFAYEEGVGERLNQYYGGDHWKKRLQTFIQNISVVDTMKKQPTFRQGGEIDPYGSLWRTDRRPFHLERPALSAPSFQGYTWPDPETFFVDEVELKKCRQQARDHCQEQFIIGIIGWGLFETSWGIRGFENVLMDIACEPEFYHDLLDRIADQFLAYIDFTCEQLPEIDAVMFGDDWGDQRGVIVGPDRWREFFKPRYARIYQKVHARKKVVVSHCCGSVADIMPDIIEIGLDVLESVQPEAVGMNPYDLKANWGDRIAFWGCLGSQSTLPFGTPGQVFDEVNRLRCEMAKGGGYILAPAKELQPETPTDNAVALVEALAAGLTAK